LYNLLNILVSCSK